MTKRRTPQEKKTLDYSKQFINQAEYPHAFRKSWPRTEAKSKRIYRHKVTQLLQQVQSEASSEDFVELSATDLPIRRNIVRKWGVTSLGDSVAEGLRWRTYKTGWNFFKKNYDSQLHRAKFVSFLTALTTGRKGEAELLAHYFNSVLQPPEKITIVENSEKARPRMQDWYGEQAALRIQGWLSDFFKDEPEWELRLREWIRTVTTENHSGSSGKTGERINIR